MTIPTYEVGTPEKAPMFLEKRVYQGSSGVVYPYPVIESISDEKRDVEYDAIYLENEYLKVMILPQLGGRVQMAYDKIARRHFIYYNHVIKNIPGLVENNFHRTVFRFLQDYCPCDKSYERYFKRNRISGDVEPESPVHVSNGTGPAGSQYGSPDKRLPLAVRNTA